MIVDVVRMRAGGIKLLPDQLKATTPLRGRLKIRPHEWRETWAPHRPKVLDAVVAMGHSDALAGRMQVAEAEKRALEAELAGVQASEPATIIEDVMARYRRMTLQLQGMLAKKTDRSRARQILAETLGPVTLRRDRETGVNYAELDEPAERLLVQAVGESLKVVARAGFEPATFGL